MQSENPLVSIIIPCFNYGRYLPEAFESIFSQSYPNIEIILIDDGSTDDTRQIVERYNKVKYFYQANKGLSAARNAGIENSSGDFLVFLDADDWLLPDAITTNLSYLMQDEALAFVSGGHKKVSAENGRTESFYEEIVGDHYYFFLHYDYIGMVASVMFTRWALDEFLFDTGMTACHCYDLFIRIARKYPVQHHAKMIAAYRIHYPSMSKDPTFMFKGKLRLLDKQRVSLRNKREVKAYKAGKRGAREYYYPKIYLDSQWIRDKSLKGVVTKALLKYPRFTYLRFRVLTVTVKSFIKRAAPDFVLSRIHKAGLYESFVPKPER